MQNTIENTYSKRISDLESQIKKVKKILIYLYLIRLITFISFATFLIYFFLSQYKFLFIVLSVCSLIIFLIAVKLDLHFDKKKSFLSNKLLINKNELKFMEHIYDDRNPGDEFNSLNNNLAIDFDIFGHGSLFQYLNRCSTKKGNSLLAKVLCHPETDRKIIEEKQISIEELSKNIEFMQNFQAHGMFISENGNELENLQSWMKLPFKKNKFFLLCTVVPLINLVWISLIVFGVLPLSSSLVLLVSINLAIILLNGKKINKAHSMLEKQAKTFKKYSVLIKLIEEESFKSNYTSKIKQQLTFQGVWASESLNSLFKLLNSFDLRLNIFVAFILNSLMLFDIQVYYRLEKWKEKNKNAVLQWFEALSEMDLLISLSTFAYNNQGSVSYPKIVDEEFVLKAVEMGHPLLSASVRVCNDIKISGTPSVIIITGANMAGKSTFLRTISVNLILAMSGAPVCAKDFVFTPCDILSSIKIQDSLTNNESYFYAELSRLKDIIYQVTLNKRTFVVLDEILRGTNTKDKQSGSSGILKKLISLNAVVIIATHDLTIAELEKSYPDSVVNYCFEVELSDDQLIFDYKLKNGISQKLNASFLMKKMGII